MSEEIVRIKGTKAGLQLLFAAGATYAAIEAEIREKLAAGSGFFCRGTVMHALAGSLPEEEMEKLRRLFHENGVIFSVSRAHFAPQAETQRPSPAQEAVRLSCRVRLYILIMRVSSHAARRCTVHLVM